MSDSDGKLALRHSYYTPSHISKRSAQNVCKSDVNLRCADTPNYATFPHSRNSCGEYYKRYDHDEVLVKDYTSFTNTATGDSGKMSITNSELDKLEKQVFKDIPKELQIDKDSVESLDSHVKFFRSTVQQIFDKFYTSMQDFELYKKKFHEILESTKVESVDEMEDFVKKVIQHIMSAQSSTSNESGAGESKKTYDVSTHDESDITITTSSSGKLLENLCSVVEAYKNDNYLTDSTIDEVSSKTDYKKDEIFNIFLLSATPFMEIKMNDRNLLSEINIRDQSSVESKFASAENIKKLAAKRQELEKYVYMQQADMPDRDIPIRISSAKKNIHTDEDFAHRQCENKSFMSKICNYLCKKFRKNSL